MLHASRLNVTGCFTFWMNRIWCFRNFSSFFHKAGIAQRSILLALRPCVGDREVSLYKLSLLNYDRRRSYYIWNYGPVSRHVGLLQKISPPSEAETCLWAKSETSIMKKGTKLLAGQNTSCSFIKYFFKKAWLNDLSAACKLAKPRSASPCTLT